MIFNLENFSHDVQDFALHFSLLETCYLHAEFHVYNFTFWQYFTLLQYLEMRFNSKSVRLLGTCTFLITQACIAYCTNSSQSYITSHTIVTKVTNNLIIVDSIFVNFKIQVLYIGCVIFGPAIALQTGIFCLVKRMCWHVGTPERCLSTKMFGYFVAWILMKNLDLSLSLPTILCLKRRLR